MKLATGNKDWIFVIAVSIGLALLSAHSGYCRGKIEEEGISGPGSGAWQLEDVLKKKREKRIIDEFGQKLHRAQFYMQSARYDDAIKILEELVAEKPDVVQVAEMLSSCYLRSGKKEKTIEFCREKLQRFPMNYSLAVNMGQAYLLLGNREKAVEAWRTLLSEDEMRAGFYGIVARIEIENGLYEEAEKTLREGLRFEPFRSRYTSELVRLLKSMGKYEEAFIENCSAVINYGRSWGWQRVKDMISTSSAIEKKERLFEIADSISARLPGDDPYPTLTRALLYVANGKYREAYRVLERMKKGKY